MLKKISSILFFLGLAGILSTPLVTLAQITPPTQEAQQASQQITEGPISLDVPAGFPFPTVFMPLPGHDAIYSAKILEPVDVDDENHSILKVHDINTTNNFNVTLQISDFTSGTNTIPSSNFYVTTLARDLSTGVDADPSSPPASSPDPLTSNQITAPNFCPWDYLTGNINGACWNTCVLNQCGYFVQYDPANPITILSAPEPQTGGIGTRIGAWSVGFGIKVKVDPGLQPGTYSGTLTFDLSCMRLDGITPNPSCEP